MARLSAVLAVLCLWSAACMAHVTLTSNNTHNSTDGNLTSAEELNVVIVNASDPCQFNVCNGTQCKHFDLSAHSDPVDFEGSLGKYRLSACSAVPGPTASCQSSTDMAAWQYSDTICHGLGKASTMATSYDGTNLMVNFTDGDAAGAYAYKISITFKCDHSASGAAPTSIEYLGFFAYTATWSSPHACPSGGGGGGGGGGGTSGVGVFLIILTVVLIVYFIVGAAYLFKVKGHSGKDVIIHREFWLEIPSLVKDGVVFTFGTIKVTVNRLRGQHDTVV